MKYNEEVRQHMLKPGFVPAEAMAILRVGLPSIITMGLSSLTSFMINQILLVYSTTATAVYGVWMKLQNFCYMPSFGLNNGLVPVLSYNYGIGRKDRVHEAMKLSVSAIGILMVTLMIIFEIVPGTVLTMFNAGEMMREIGMVCLRACVLSLPFGAVSMILSTSMQALDHARYSFVINIMRQCVLLIGSFFLLSRLTGSIRMIWFAVPFTEIVNFCLSLLLYRQFRKHLNI